jgi:hypothetical protein
MLTRYRYRPRVTERSATEQIRCKIDRLEATLRGLLHADAKSSLDEHMRASLEESEYAAWKESGHFTLNAYEQASHNACRMAKRPATLTELLETAEALFTKKGGTNYDQSTMKKHCLAIIKEMEMEDAVTISYSFDSQWW